MLKFLAQTIDDILPVNPLALFKKDAGVKLDKMFERGVSGFKNKASEGMRGYFGGKQYGSMASLGKDPRATRNIAAGIGGGLIAANTLGFNPFGITDIATNVAMLGAHGILGGAMIRHGSGLSRGLGLGYIGLAGVNALRKGDNLGPL